MLIMTTLTLLAFSATILPLAYFLIRILPKTKPFSAAAALIIAAIFGLFLFTRHHEDAYSGLDTAAYGAMADAFREGHPLISQDEVASAMPPSRLLDFLYRAPKDANSSCRPTRTTTFQIDIGKKNYARTFPFYMPMLSMAEAGSGLGRNFIPLVGMLWVAMLLMTAIRFGGIIGIIPALALILCTVYPSWFFRGEFAEAVAFPLITSAWLSAMAKPFKKKISYAIAGFTMTFALAFHLTAALLAAPIALAIIVTSRDIKERISLLFGAVVGFIPLWLITRYVCAPYGNWTKLSALKHIATSHLEHSVLFFGVVLLALLTVGVIALASNKKLRIVAYSINKRLPAWSWLIVGIIPAVLLALLASPLKDRFNLAISLSWQSLHAAPIILWIVASLAMLHNQKRISRRILWLLVCWVTCAFLLILGQEVSANHGRTIGAWSFRRMLPPIIAFIAIFLSPLAKRFAALNGLHKKIAISLLTVLMLYTPIKHHLAYTAINGQGSEKIANEISLELDKLAPSPIIFDYFLHSVPFSSKPNNRIVGIGDHARQNWNRVAAWISTIAQTGTVHIVSSYTPPKLELDMAFIPVKAFNADISMASSSTILDVKNTAKKISNTLIKPIHLSKLDSDTLLEQEIVYDGSPIGLRGNWHFMRKGGAWSRSNSGIVAPLPSSGTNIVAELDVSWYPPEGGPSNQMVRITYPGIKYLALITVKAGRQTIKTTFVSEKANPAMGIYTITPVNPYNPAAYGMKNFPNDLGVFFHKVTFTQTITGNTGK